MITANATQLNIGELTNQAALTGHDLLLNSCSTNVADAFGAAGLIVHDPRYSSFTVSPRDLQIGLQHSRRLIDVATYPKQPKQ
jgi:hypothetical protein